MVAVAETARNGECTATCHSPLFMASSVQTKTHYIPFTSPPTPSPSPGPSQPSPQNLTLERQHYLNSVVHSCTPEELLFLSQAIVPLLKRDILGSLPCELALHILGFIDDCRTLVRVGMVSRAWSDLAAEESAWKGLCAFYGFGGGSSGSSSERTDEERAEGAIAHVPRRRAVREGPQESDNGQLLPTFSYRSHFKECYITSSSISFTCSSSNKSDLLLMSTSTELAAWWTLTSFTRPAHAFGCGPAACHHPPTCVILPDHLS